MNPTFYRFRFGSSSSDGVWEYNYTYANLSKEEAIEELREILEYRYCDFKESEHYRGIEFEIIDELPQEWIKRKIRIAQAELCGIQHTLDFLQSLETGEEAELRKFKKIKKKKNKKENRKM